MIFPRQISICTEGLRMPELFLELFSEEIPARMQRGGAADLERLVGEALSPLIPKLIETRYGPRRLALWAEVLSEIPASRQTQRGPRINAPEQAISGFLRKHGADNRDQLRQEDGYWVLDRVMQASPAADLIAGTLPGLLRRFPWPKSMRWGGSSNFVWVRPLRRIVCLLDRAVVPFDLRDGDDDGHGLASGDLTEGHRFHAPGAFAVSGAADWQKKLAERRVLVDAADRKRIIAEGIASKASSRQLAVVDDPGLLDEVAGLVEWPVPLLGRIAAEHMDLPPEVMQVSMRVNQRYFALRGLDGAAAPYFGFVANIAAEDGGATIIAGNERVLRARFADARHFWDLDRKTRLESRVPLLDHVTFHASLGTQGERVIRLRRLAGIIAPQVGAGTALAERAAELAKADLVSGMVGEFPELQGVMGRYYALHDNEDRLVADAIRDHYAPKGPTDAPPTSPVSIAVALADKLDQLVGFFAIGEKPTGAGDPYALRRAALGVIRIIRENRLRISLRRLLAEHYGCVHADMLSVNQRALDAGVRDAERLGADLDKAMTLAGTFYEDADALAAELLAFIAERLRVQLRAEGARHDVLTAVFASGADDDIVRLLARTDAVTALLRTEDGANLLTAYRRAANILRIEERKDGPHTAAPDPGLFREPAEIDLHHALHAMHDVEQRLEHEDYTAAMIAMAHLRSPLDAFFDKVTVNAGEPDLRRNRLRLVNLVRSSMDRVADFSRIEG
jgi:glycyl-tRNA synthetase beta chain